MYVCIYIYIYVIHDESSILYNIEWPHRALPRPPPPTPRPSAPRAAARPHSVNMLLCIAPYISIHAARNIWLTMYIYIYIYIYISVLQMQVGHVYIHGGFRRFPTVVLFQAFEDLLPRIFANVGIKQGAIMLTKTNLDFDIIFVLMGFKNGENSSIRSHALSYTFN